MANYRILTKNDLRNHYFAIGEKALKRIDVDQPITLICNGKVYKSRNIDKTLGYGHLYARKDFFDDNHLEIGDRLVFDIEESLNTIRIMVIKSEEIIDFDTESKTDSADTSFLKERFLSLINELKNNFKENEWCFRASEENVRVELIDPILAAIGWRMPYLRREFDRMDYVLCDEKALSNSSNILIIEAKKYRELLLTDKPNESASQCNQEQIGGYLKKNEISIRYGILTNGIRWCLFKKGEQNCIGEIDILNSTDEKIYNFFHSISKTELKKLDNLIKQLDNPKKEERPKTIMLGNNPSKSQKEACVSIAKEFLKKTKKPKDFCFTQKIIINESANHNEEMYNDFYINHYRGIFEQLMILQEINSTFDLGLSISAE